MLRIKYCKFLIIIILACSFTACSLTQKNSPISNTFLEDVDVTKKLENLPFEHSWVWVEVNNGDYDAIYIPPITIDRIPKDYWKKSITTIIGSEDSFKKEAALIAAYFRNKLIEDAKKYPEPVFRIAEEPGPKVLTMEIAITEIEFSHPVARAAALAAPVPGVGAAISTVSSPHAAFALRFTDSVSKKLIATAADRKYPPARLIDFNKLTVTSSVREVCGIWSEKMIETLNKGRLAKVKNSSAISLLPW